MLPSTGYFKGLNCPFYDNGVCERPYCHFRHVKKDTHNNGIDGTESGTILQQQASETAAKIPLQNDKDPTDLLHSVASDKSIENANGKGAFISKAAYNPTPISELNKMQKLEDEDQADCDKKRRHIPVPYTPRKPATYAIKRPIDLNGSSKPFVYIPPEKKYIPGANAKIDPYTPAGSVESKDKYLPGNEKELQEYTLEEKNTSTSSNYVPSDKKKKILEYQPKKVRAVPNVPIATYNPTPLSQVPCFSSDEDEPVSKKPKSSNEINALDNLDTEFEMLGQILDEEKSTEEVNVKMNKHSAPKIEINDSPIREITLKSKKCSSTEKSDLEKHSKSNASHNKSRSKSSSKEDVKNKIKNSFKDKHSSSSSSKRHSNEYDKTKVRQKESSTQKHDPDLSSGSPHKNSSKSDNQSLSIHSKSSKHKIDKLPESKLKHSHSSKSDLNKGEKNKKASDKDKYERYKNKHEKDRHSKHEKYKSKHERESSSDKKSKREERSSDKKSKHKRRTLSEESINMNGDILSAQNNADSDVELIDEVSESDEETIALECKKIFEEYVPTFKHVDAKQTIVEDSVIEDDEYIPTVKKRISHTTDKNIKVVPRAPIKPDFKVNAAQAMAERLAKVREYHSSKNTLLSTEALVKPEIAKIMPTPSTTSKIRIAHVPYASTLLNAKKHILSKPVATKHTPQINQSTIVQTIAKGAQRVAHIPNEKFIDRPGVLEPLSSKIPANIRSTYLNMMIDQCLKIYLTPIDAYARAQHEELTTSKKCISVQIYKNSAILTISRLKKEILECNGVKKSGTDFSTSQNLPGSDSNKSDAPSWSIVSRNRKSSVDEFKGAKFYDNINKWILTEEQLRENGFPRPHESGEKGRAIIYVENKRRKPPKGFIRTCCRCNKEYTVDKKGFPVVSEDCIYHPNNKYRFRGEVKYQCCSQDGTSDGCCMAPTHVFEYVDYANLRGYVKTMHPEKELNDYGVYALDCEMCYTTQGLDLTRVTVIDSACRTVYETLIKPLHPIIDYNTRYSGITEEQMADVTTTLLDVQATLLTMFNNKTILIGHSLESDFKALKLIHDTVVDTSVLFPHKMGPPYKRALRNLSSEYLRKIIQNSIDGHNSAEDATVCMELIHYKLKEDLKTR